MGASLEDSEYSSLIIIDAAEIALQELKIRNANIKNKYIREISEMQVHVGMRGGSVLLREGVLLSRLFFGVVGNGKQYTGRLE